ARKRLGDRRLWAIIEPRSNTMRMGSHKDGLAHSARLADEVIWYQPEGLDWDLQPVIEAASNHAQVSRSLDEIIERIVNEAGEGDAVVIMSNGGFGGLHQKLMSALKAKAA
ncbi:UDP-N-acetylmuramate:L-alanyl-gamma-D-glutamyl-meso-diaminopimelate ligase, partial [Acinetobacter baumannii]